MAKCLRHLTGVAHLLQRFSDPVTQCSSPTRRTTLEWYCNLEDYCCFVTATPQLLPVTWRQENVRQRQQLAHLEYPRLSGIERKARLLDDLWAQLWELLPQMAKVLTTLPRLKTLDGEDRFRAAMMLQSQLELFERDLKGFVEYPHVKDVFESIDLTPPSPCNHTTCCPERPFTPLVLEFPPAGFLKMTVLAIQAYNKTCLWPPIQKELGLRDTFLPLDTIAIEIMRTFAGLEYMFGDCYDALFPCFSPLSIAGMTCPLKMRPWLWHKLSHFEQLGEYVFIPLKKRLAFLWNLPKLSKEGFGAWRCCPPDHAVRDLDVGDIALVSQMATLELHDDATTTDVTIVRDG